ncbi:hypothetical protein BT63DRAFT_423938 [Microthyrium microscopicum]|uniref:SGF29 C-terminal domain-containing protein n=1 Tax=Microthyrium microscopicum TaxID=703497 RepID=A0A6A6UEB0_9PEZI|nr:hypothetical protein BT63DRAFT_423938 [Microthyrium microscopicum]
MASRNRGRQGPVKTDADEERHMWNQLRSDAKRADQLVAEHNAKWTRMLEIKTILESQHANGDDTSKTLEDELAKLSRENITLCEDIYTAIHGQSDNDDSILTSLDLLKALRSSSEKDTLLVPPPRASAFGKSGVRSKHRTKAAAIAAAAAERENGSSAEDRDVSVGPSPVVSSPKTLGPGGPGGTRFKSASRAGSVPVVREPSVKIEDGIDSGAEMPKAEKLRFVMGTEVFYRTKKLGSRSQDKDDQGEGILCTITNVIGEGTKRKYEILDVEPDEGASPYRASVSQMSAIPERNEGLTDPAPRRTVLAMYPGTTTFYRAEVVTVKGKEVPSGHVRLRFEDEDDKNTEMNVERRYVLLQWPGQ